ncbi:protein NRT1/ PTR FAMILY 5.14-like [Pyrus ussuriensis x Pyrus communis]|uniref:Protein NRT1/ PTR FAMILY 5.14-like n=1 Tax=Pyrus ussuriensis x Pyrus communis TaxID=2448454 RepID=A0A5N5FDR3_9ROSA|nr:protein NRT1/ PTR FAMILY 5.14-like [Pyrus ussuriensis x Pyrus communis]
MGRFSRTLTTLSEGTVRGLIQIGIKWGHYNVFPGKCCHMVRKWLGNHFYFSKATTCIRGLVFSHSFVNHAIVGILITYLTEVWSTEQFEMAAVVTNLQEGITDVMVIVLAHISDTHKSRFKMIVSTNAAYFIGLLLLWICSKFTSAQTSAKVYYGAAILLGLGEAGRSATLEEFLDDQYVSEQKQTPSSDENYLIRLETRRKALWSHPWFLGAFISIFLTTESWTRTFFISATLVGASYLVFFLGYSCYFVRSRIDESNYQSRLKYIEKLAILYPVPQQRGGEICMVTRFASSSPLGGQEEQKKKLWPLIKLKGEKWFLIEVIAMWSTFLAYSLVEATGSTFFFDQMSNLDDKFGSLTVRPIYFKLLGSLSCFLVLFLYELLVPKQWRKATLVRIGLGLGCSVLCCVAAWQVERKRLKLVRNEGLEYDTSKATSMSILWLVPQFFLLGLMKGLAMEGLINFLADRIDNNIDRLRAWYYASHITDFTIGVGKIITAISILVFRRIWFDYSINRSHLEIFYELLTFLSLINVIYYVCISFYLYGNEESQNSGDRENEKITELAELVEGRNADDENEVLDPPAGGADNEDEQTTMEEVLELNDEDEVPLDRMTFTGAQSDREIESQKW